MNFKLWEIKYTTNYVLRKVFTFNEAVVNKESQEDTMHYWLSPHDNDPFYQWLRKHEVKFTPGTLPNFTDGGQGRAYFLGDKVIKFTKNRVEANVAKAAIGQETPTAIIDVWRAPGGTPLWAILQKYVNVNIEQELRDAADIVSVMIDDMKDHDPHFSHFPESPQEQKTLATQAVRKYRKPLTLVPYIVSAMIAVNQLYYKTGFTHDDLGPNNVARDFQTGRIVFHDLGPNVGKNFKARPVLDRIHQNREKLGLPALAEA